MLTLCYEGLLIGFWFIDHGWVTYTLSSYTLLQDLHLQPSSEMVLSFHRCHEVSLIITLGMKIDTPAQYSFRDL